MKKLAVAMVMVLTIGLLSTAGFAAWQGKGPAGQVDVTAFREFQQETAQLRDEAMVKRLELRNEYAKGTPDQSKITALQGEITSLRAQIQQVAEKKGLPAWGKGAGRGFGGGMMGCGGRGFGAGACGGCPAATQE
jgi:hypothetical protein